MVEFIKKCILKHPNNIYSLIKSWVFLVCNIFHLIPPLLIFYIYFTIFYKESYLLSNELESMEILTPSGFNDKPEGAK